MPVTNVRSGPAVPKLARHSGVRTFLRTREEAMARKTDLALTRLESKAGGAAPPRLVDAAV